jgi:hypothetical protein
MCESPLGDKAVFCNSSRVICHSVGLAHEHNQYRNQTSPNIFCYNIFFNMSWPHPEGSTDPITMWDIPWEPMKQAPYPMYCKKLVKSAVCRCTPEQKNIARQLFPDKMALLSTAKPSSSKKQLILTNVRKMLPLRFQQPATASTPSISINTDNLSFAEASPRLNNPSTFLKINNLPKEILYYILQLVYDTEDRSRGLCHCSRPTELYKTIRATALEHKIVNTVNLRRVCSVFHTWAVENIFRSHNGNELEIDFSNLANLKQRLKITGPGLIRRLTEDFPALSQSGATLYLGSPGQISNLKLVLETLSEVKDNPFSGISLWSLNYYYRDLPIPGYADLVVQHISEIDDIPMMDWNAEGERAALALQALCLPFYSQDWQLFLEIVLKLMHRPLSMLHLPAPRLLETLSYGDVDTLARVASDCKTAVLHEFWFFPERHEEEIIAKLEETLSQTRFEELFIMPQMKTILELYLRALQDDMTIRGSTITR